MHRRRMRRCAGGITCIDAGVSCEHDRYIKIGETHDESDVVGAGLPRREWGGGRIFRGGALSVRKSLSVYK